MAATNKSGKMVSRLGSSQVLNLKLTEIMIDQLRELPDREFQVLLLTLTDRLAPSCHP